MWPGQVFSSHFCDKLLLIIITINLFYWQNTEKISEKSPHESVKVFLEIFQTLDVFITSFLF